MVKEAFVQYGIPLAVIVVAGALSRALHMLSGYLQQKAQAAEAEHQSSFQARPLRAAEVLTSCAADSVIKVESTLRPTIAEVTAEGKLTLEGAQRLRDEAVTLAWAQARVCYGSALKAGGFDQWDPPLALAHFADTAAAKYAGDSRTNVAFERATTQPAVPRA